MENCVRGGRTVCTYDLKDNNGYYYEELVLEWKQAAALRLLTCPECGAHVYLAAGQIMEPYFAHYDLVECEYGGGHESEELRKGKRLLYSMFRRSFPDDEVMARKRMDNGLYSTLYCTRKDRMDIALDFRLQYNSLEKFMERDTFYQGNHIIPVYVLGVRQEKDLLQLDWFQNLIQTSMGYVAFLEVEREMLHLKKSFSYRIGKQRKFRICRRSYPVKELILNQEGRFITDFDIECDKIKIQIENEKEQYQRDQERNTEWYRSKPEISQEQLQREQEWQEKVQLSRDREMAEAYGNLDPIILEKCRKLIKEGNAHLVSKKYYDAIMKG